MTMTLKILSAAGAGVAALSLVSAAQAQSQAPKAGQFVVRTGLAGVLFDSKGDFTFAGQPVPGGSLKLNDNASIALEGAYYLNPELSVSLTVGVPPVTTAHGVGTLAPLGRLGAVKYGTGVALAKYQYNGLGRFQPWVGGGATWMVIFKNKDGALNNVDVDNHWGGAVQVGADYMITEKWGLYASASKLFLHTNGVGTFSGLPVTTKITLDPTILQAGFNVRF